MVSGENNTSSISNLKCSMDVKQFHLKGYIVFVYLTHTKVFILLNSDPLTLTYHLLMYCITVRRNMNLQLLWACRQTPITSVKPATYFQRCHNYEKFVQDLKCSWPSITSGRA